MKKLLAVGLLSISLLTMTGCGQTEEDIRKDAEFVKVCRDSGGRVTHNLVNQMWCVFAPG